MVEGDHFIWCSHTCLRIIVSLQNGRADFWDTLDPGNFCFQKPPVWGGRLLSYPNSDGFAGAVFGEAELGAERGVGFVGVGKRGIGGELEINAGGGDLSEQTLRFTMGFPEDSTRACPFRHPPSGSSR